RKLLEEAKGLFDNIVYYWDQLLFKRSFRQRLRDAWGELRDILANLATELRDNITDTIKNDLRRVGFDGNQLKLKLDTLTEIWSRFHENELPFLKDLLEYLSVCFDSLAKAFPQL